jgi:hypothetical protein
MNSGIGDIDDYILNNNIGCIITKFDDKEYRKQLIYFFNDLEGRINIGKRCRDAATNILSLEKGIYKYLHVYRKAFKENV